jgi:hypothetical protein
MTSKVRLAGRVLGVATLALVLTGCIKVAQDLTLNADNTVDGTATIAVSKELLQLSGQTEDEAISSLTESDAPLPAGVEFTTEKYDDGDFVGQTYTFSGVGIDKFAGSSDGELSIVREGDTFRVSGNLDLSGGDAGIDPNDPTTKQLLSTFEVRISVTFPGPVDTANGEIDGKTVTWSPSFGDNLELSAVGSAVDSGGGGMLLWILIGAAVLVVIVLLVVMSSRRSKNTSAEAPAAGTGFSPPGEAAAAAGAVGGPPAPMQPPATPVPMSTPEATTPPPPSDTAPMSEAAAPETDPPAGPPADPPADPPAGDDA